MNGSALAVIALFPMIVGPLPQEAVTLTAKLCGGGEIVIPLNGSAPDQGSDCHPKACHAGTCRQKAKCAI